MNLVSLLGYQTTEEGRGKKSTNNREGRPRQMIGLGLNITALKQRE
jgi:hypothetical protein